MSKDIGIAVVLWVVFLLLLLAALTGCATCREYPKTCAAMGAFAVASVAVSIPHHEDKRMPGRFPVCRPHGDVELPPGGC